MYKGISDSLDEYYRVKDGYIAHSAFNLPTNNINENDIRFIIITDKNSNDLLRIPFPQKFRSINSFEDAVYKNIEWKLNDKNKEKYDVIKQLSEEQLDLLRTSNVRAKDIITIHFNNQIDFTQLHFIHLFISKIGMVKEVDNERITFVI